MSFLDPIIRQLEGLFQFLIGKDDWRDKLNVSYDGVAHSSVAIIISLIFASGVQLAFWKIAPSLGPGFSEATVGQSFSVFAASKTIAFLLSWIASVGLLLLLAKSLEHALPASVIIVAFNWAQVPVNASDFLLMASWNLSGSIDIARTLSILVLGFQLALHWILIERLFRTNAAHTIAIIAMLVLITIGFAAMLNAIFSLTF